MKSWQEASLAVLVVFLLAWFIAWCWWQAYESGLLHALFMGGYERYLR